VVTLGLRQIRMTTYNFILFPFSLCTHQSQISLLSDIRMSIWSLFASPSLRLEIPTSIQHPIPLSQTPSTTYSNYESSDIFLERNPSSRGNLYGSWENRLPDRGTAICGSESNSAGVHDRNRHFPKLRMMVPNEGLAWSRRKRKGVEHSM
jgi:hypothetical protein